MGALLRWLVILLFIVVGIVIGVLNPHNVSINVFIQTLEIPLSIVISVSLLLGVIVGAALVIYKSMTLSWQLHQKSKQHDKLYNELIQCKKQLAEIELDKKSQTSSNTQLMEVTK